MERVILDKPKANPTFISSWIIKPLSLCDELINYFESNNSKQRVGLTISGINTETKDTTDITIKPKDIILPGNEIFKEYMEEIFKCHKDYISQWEFLQNNPRKYEIGNFKLGRYKPGQHFKKIHTERFSLASLHRVFVFMTYLNDVDEGGSTYFNNYDLEIKPKKGLTLIWPAEWTHSHRGNILKAGLKYIVSGWINFSY